MEFQERTAPAKCPLCRERCDTRDLRPNKALEGLASAVQVARALLIALASSVKAPPVREQPARAAKRPRTAPPKPTPVPRDPEQVPDSSESQASSLAESSFSPSLSQSQPTAAKGCMVRHPSTQSVPRMQVTTVERCVGIVYPSNVDHPPLVLQFFDMLQIGAPTPGWSQAVHSSPSLMATANKSIEQPYTALHAAITAASGSGHLTATARSQGPQI